MENSSYKNYKCLNCGNSVRFNPTNSMWSCNFCGSNFNLDEVEKSVINSMSSESNMYKDYDEEAENKLETELKQDFKQYNCNNCGAEVVLEKTNASIHCIYCKSPIVVMEKLEGKFLPDMLIPFKITKSDAEKIYKEWISKRIFAPKEFKVDETISDIKGIYAPFWLFDSDLSGYISGTATRVRTWSDSNYNYTETSYYDVSRNGHSVYENVPVDSSTKLQDDLMQAIEPYSYDELVDFNPAYLSGFLAERFDVGVDKSAEVAQKRFFDFLEERLSHTVSGYSSFTITNKNFSVHSINYMNAMMPVYLLANEYKNSIRYFMINAQSGKVYGDTPYDYMKIFLYFISLFFFSFIILILIGGILA